jgi:CRP-like cAMP-binding protein
MIGNGISTAGPDRATTPHPLSALQRRHRIFAGLTHDQVERLLRSGRIESVNAGQLLYSCGDASRRFFLILEGQVHLSLHTAHGAEKIIDIQGPDDVFAEAVAFMEHPVYQMTATAATAARVMSFPNQVYIEILRENAAACLLVLQHVSSRLHVRIREIGGIVLESATSRLVRLLEDRMPADATDSAIIRLEESRQELASCLAIKPETLSRALRTLADGGAILVRGKAIEVLSRARLRQYLDDLEFARNHG